MLHYVSAGVIIAGNEGGGSKTHLPGWAIFLILLACGAALYFGGKQK